MHPFFPSPSRSNTTSLYSTHITTNIDTKMFKATTGKQQTLFDAEKSREERDKIKRERASSGLAPTKPSNGSANTQTSPRRESSGFTSTKMSKGSQHAQTPQREASSGPASTKPSIGFGNTRNPQRKVSPGPVATKPSNDNQGAQISRMKATSGPAWTKSSHGLQNTPKRSGLEIRAKLGHTSKTPEPSIRDMSESGQKAKTFNRVEDRYKMSQASKKPLPGVRNRPESGPTPNKPNGASQMPVVPSPSRKRTRDLEEPETIKASKKSHTMSETSTTPNTLKKHKRDIEEDESSKSPKMRHDKDYGQSDTGSPQIRKSTKEDRSFTKTHPQPKEPNSNNTKGTYVSPSMQTELERKGDNERDELKSAWSPKFQKVQSQTSKVVDAGLPKNRPVSERPRDENFLENLSQPHNGNGRHEDSTSSESVPTAKRSERRPSATKAGRAPSSPRGSGKNRYENAERDTVRVDHPGIDEETEVAEESTDVAGPEAAGDPEAARKSDDAEHSEYVNESGAAEDSEFSELSDAVRLSEELEGPDKSEPIRPSAPRSRQQNHRPSKPRPSKPQQSPKEQVVQRGGRKRVQSPTSEGEEEYESSSSQSLETLQDVEDFDWQARSLNSDDRENSLEMSEDVAMEDSSTTAECLQNSTSTRPSFYLKLNHRGLPKFLCCSQYTDSNIRLGFNMQLEALLEVKSAIKQILQDDVGLRGKIEKGHWEVKYVDYVYRQLKERFLHLQNSRIPDWWAWYAISKLYFEAAKCQSSPLQSPRTEQRVGGIIPYKYCTIVVKASSEGVDRFPIRLMDLRVTNTDDPEDNEVPFARDLDPSQLKLEMLKNILLRSGVTFDGVFKYLGTRNMSSLIGGPVFILKTDWDMYEMITFMHFYHRGKERTFYLEICTPNDASLPRSPRHPPMPPGIPSMDLFSDRRYRHFWNLQKGKGGTAMKGRRLAWIGKMYPGLRYIEPPPASTPEGSQGSEGS